MKKLPAILVLGLSLSGCIEETAAPTPNIPNNDPDSPNLHQPDNPQAVFVQQLGLQPGYFTGVCVFLNNGQASQRIFDVDELANVRMETLFFSDACVTPIGNGVLTHLGQIKNVEDHGSNLFTVTVQKATLHPLTDGEANPEHVFHLQVEGIDQFNRLDSLDTAPEDAESFFQLYAADPGSELPFVDQVLIQDCQNDDDGAQESYQDVRMYTSTYRVVTSQITYGGLDCQANDRSSSGILSIGPSINSSWAYAYQNGNAHRINTQTLEEWITLDTDQVTIESGLTAEPGNRFTYTYRYFY